MTGRSASAPATTPQGRESPPRRSARAADQANRGRRFGGMKRMFGKAEDPPSDAAGTPVGYGTSGRQVRSNSYPITRRSMDEDRGRRCRRAEARFPIPDP